MQLMLRIMLCVAFTLTLLAAPNTVQQSKQLSLLASSSALSITPGQHVSLALDIELKPKMHVYAPGIERYIGIDWQVDPSPAIKTEAVAWPKPEVLHLDAINETVPVYKGQLRLGRDVVFGSASAIRALVDDKGEITLKGKLKYQACDDRMCYIPASVPLQWTFTYAK